MATPSSPAETPLRKAEKLEHLRRKMAAIPARSDGTEPATPSVMLHPVGEREPTPIVATAQTGSRTLPVPEPLADLLPRRGLTRGTVVSVSGANSVLIGIIASVTAAGGHAAVIGLPNLGLLAAVEQGADLSRLSLVRDPKGSAVEVAAILLDGFDLVVLGLSGATATPSRTRAVIARARSKGAVLVIAEGHWDSPDLRIESRVAGYTGLGQGLAQGRGRVLTVQLDVAATGKSFQRRSARMEIGAHDGKTAWRTVAPVNGSSEIDTLMRPAL